MITYLIVFSILWTLVFTVGCLVVAADRRIAKRYFNSCK